MIKETTPGVTQQGKKISFISAEGCSHRLESDRQSTLSGESAQFLSLSAPHLDGWVWVHNLCNWLLRKGGTWSKGDLEAGRTRKFFWAIFILQTV
jgi:hypothetical protein